MTPDTQARLCAAARDRTLSDRVDRLTAQNALVRRVRRGLRAIVTAAVDPGPPSTPGAPA